MDSGAGRRKAPELTAVTERLEIERAEVLPAWALPGVPFAPAWQPDEAQTEWTPLVRAGWGAPPWWPEEPAWAVQARRPRLERPGRKGCQPASGEPPVVAALPRVLLRRVLQGEE
ncbi:MAG TPA: hypothetical protein VK899_09575 [Gemmatimonadales bacterium]|nr:hypothetical protein [Gemmatimonadales bacterium]